MIKDIWQSLIKPINQWRFRNRICEPNVVAGYAGVNGGKDFSRVELWMCGSKIRCRCGGTLKADFLDS